MHASSWQRFVIAYGDDGLNVVLHVPVVEVKFQFVGIFEIVLHHHDEVVRLVAICRVVQPELIVFKQVAVVGQEGKPPAIFSVPSPSNWKYRMV